METRPDVGPPSSSENSSPVPAEKLARWRGCGAKTPVRIRGPHGKTAEGEVYIQSWDAPARTKRATKAFFTLWALAAFSAIFPLVHFVLVPALLVAGPIAAFLLLQQSSVVLGGVGKCPACGADFEIVRANYFKPSDLWPLNDTCGTCREELLIEKRNAALELRSTL